MREVFVYYRIDIADASAVSARVRAFQATLMATHPALRARFLVRSELKDAEQTCMETYTADPARQPGGVGPDWQVAVEAAAMVLAPLLRSPRHVEVFEAGR